MEHRSILCSVHSDDIKKIDGKTDKILTKLTNLDKNMSVRLTKVEGFISAVKKFGWMIIPLAVGAYFKGCF